ncbi:MAG: hypothetical protein S4CHLAM102_00260 [Chlamydiia bacterium]|nr:hypothetical protein [Chlamydiia bacterium]
MYGIFLDTETNGLDATRHNVLEIAFRVINLSSCEHIASYNSLVCHPPEEWEKSSSQSLKVNGITFDEIQQGAPPLLVQRQIIDLFTAHNINRSTSSFICQNPSFDRQFFGKLIPSELFEAHLFPYHWLDLASMFWAKIQLENPELGQDNCTLSKDYIAKQLKIPPEKHPHRAMQGVDSLIDCYFALFNLPRQTYQNSLETKTPS